MTVEIPAGAAVLEGDLTVRSDVRGIVVFAHGTGSGRFSPRNRAGPERVGAVVSRGGRPDLAGEALRRVTAPTLLIIGGNDLEVLWLNRQALAAVAREARLEIVPGATHLFEEPGALEHVAQLARDWFLQHLARG
jgi:pimeloyl-ACP methyl ester carboxylesterase